MTVWVPGRFTAQSETSAVWRSRRSNSSSTVPRIMAPGTKGVTQSDRAASNIHLCVIEIKQAHIAQHNAGERFIEFIQVDVILGHADILQRFFRHRGRSCQHDRGFRSYRRKTTDLRTERKTVVYGKSVSVGVDLGGSRIIKKKK